tara:strand:+ start:902 stop:2089 length:1188 start_codon:yes stop_codon:yes gene_type:complete
MLDTTLPSWPSFSEDEAQVVQNILLSNKVNYWTGKECTLFEKEFCEWIDCKYSISVANGTLALDLALHALGIGNGDEVIVTPRTFIASVSCVVNRGAIPVFADVDLNSQNITAESILESISQKTKAIIVVHLAGMPAEMDAIMSLAKEYNLFVIEDCAQAHGAKYKGKSVGSLGHIGAWSFCQDKIMTTGGEGGMVTTNDKNLWEKMWSFKDHGKSYYAVQKAKEQKNSRFQWVHESFGTNYRMLEIQAGIGRHQLKKMSEWTFIRQKYCDAINLVAKEFSFLRTIKIPEYINHACYKHYIFINKDSLSSRWNRDLILEEIKKMNIPCFQGSCSEVYLEKAFEKTSFKPQNSCENAKLLGDTSLMFLVHPSIRQNQMDDLCSILFEVFTKIQKNR